MGVLIELLAEAPMAANPRILIADDISANRSVLRRALADSGCDFDEAENGAVAVELALRHEYALILLDIEMPQMDGFEVARQLRAFGRTLATPLIFVTAAYTRPEDERYGYELGAADYLMAKPVDVDVLRSKVGVFLQLHRERAQLRQEMAQMALENQQLFYENEQFRVAHEDMRRAATHDGLTDLPNRTLFEDRLEAALKRAARGHSRFAVMFLDLDKLKEVNDQYGHAAGDELLVATARRLVGAVRGSDTVARLGGDEFGLILENLDHPDAALRLGEKIHRAISTEMGLHASLHGKDVTVVPDASIGIALHPEHSARKEDLLKYADRAMYSIKQRGGGGVNLYRS